MSGQRVADFDYLLPEELIAQAPPAERGASRMLIVERATGAVRDGVFADLHEILQAGDLLVLNDSRVIPARLYARRTLVREREAPTGRIEVMLTEELAPLEWRVLVRPGRKVRTGERLVFADAAGEAVLEAEVIGRGEFGERRVRFSAVEDFLGVVERIGHMPLPPYIHRSDESADRSRYQTVYAEERGSVAAPTAGLHFTPQMLDQLKEKGIETAQVTLHVGLGTFAPLHVESVDEVVLHEERYTLPAETAEAINLARSEGRRVIAVGTTVVRTLEHCAKVADGRELEGHSGKTRIFISPGFEFRIVDGLLTNFHLPQTSLLMLVCAFAGRENVLNAYNHAVKEKYRFFSYGDCMLIS